MNTFYVIRSPRPAQLFSHVLLSAPQRVRRRRAHSREASGNGRVWARLGWAGVIGGFGLVRHGRPTDSPAPAHVTLVIPRVADLATASMDNPS